MERKIIGRILAAQLLAVLMCVSCAYATDIFSQANSMLSGYKSSILSLGRTVSIVVGMIAGICYMLSSNERTCQTAKSWFIRCLIGFALITAANSNWFTGMITSMFGAGG